MQKSNVTISSLYTAVVVFLILMTSNYAGAQLPHHFGEDRVIRIPFRYESNFIIVDTRVGGLPMHFIFDTGAEHSLLLKRSFFDLIRIPLGRKVKIYGSDLAEHQYAHIARSVPMELPNTRMIFQDMLVMDEDYTILDEISGTRIDGIIGASVFRNYVVKIDYRRQRLTLYKKEAFDQPKKGFISYPMQLHKSKPYIAAQSHFTMRDSAELMLLLDTGAGIGLILHSNSHDDIQVPEAYIETQLGMGLGGQITGFMGRVNQLKLQAFALNGVVTGFQNVDRFKLKNASFVRNGLMGNQILSRFTVIIDYPSSKLYLKPHHKFDRDFPFDRSGLTFMASGPDHHHFTIVHVQPGSPADAAGLVAGDQVLKVNGRKDQGLTLNTLCHMLRKKQGKTIKMTIQRDGVERLVSFRLKDLI